MKKWFFSLLIISFCSGYAQDTTIVVNQKQSKGYLSIFCGGAVPFNDFGSKDPYNSASGFANPGVDFGASFAHKFKSFFGVCFTYRYQINSVNVNSIEQQLEKKYSGTAWTVNSDAWKSSIFLMGTYFCFQPKKTSRLSIDLKFMFGTNNVTSPQIDFTEQTATTQSWAKQESGKSRAFTGCAGLSLRFDVSKTLCLIFAGDYISSTPVFTDIPFASSTGGGSKVNFKQQISTVNLSFGLGFTFN
jgi:hypothetical protein